MSRVQNRRRFKRRAVSWYCCCIAVVSSLGCGIIAARGTLRDDRNLSRDDVLVYVDPFIGTGGDGHTFPGPSAPFGKIQPSPDNGDGGWNWTAGYHRSSTSIFGFSNTHLSGTGVPDMMDVTMMPFCLNRGDMDGGGFREHLEHMLIKYYPADGERGDEDLYVGRFDIQAMDELLISEISHGEETVKAGYYSVVLKKHGISVELTAGHDVGMHRYVRLHEPACDEHIIALDLSRVHFPSGMSVSGRIDVAPNGDMHAVEGHRVVDAWAPDRIVYYRVEFSEAIREYLILDNSHDTLHWEGCAASGCHIAFLRFDAFDGLVARISVSSVGTKGATDALAASNALFGFHFDRLRGSTESLWRDQISAVRVFGGDETVKKILYTALYHAMLAPVVHSDLDGSFRGPDSSLHKTKTYAYYSTLSIWDTFRAHYALLILTNTKVSHDIAMTLLRHASLSSGHRLPVWALGGLETDMMPGYHAVSFLAEAIRKGVVGQNVVKTALKVAHATAQSRSYITEEHHLDQYGYVPSDVTPESISMTLEYAFDDWCIAEIAHMCGDDQLESYYRNRSTFYRNVFDTETRFMRPRKTNGHFIHDFDPSYSEHETGDFTEGTAWQYLWFAPHDIQGLVELLGGKEAAEETLDEFFFPPVTDDAGIHGDRRSVDITGLIGRYAHGNEPGHHTAYIYNLLGSSEKTQYLTRLILRTMYSDDPDGITGNDDCGQMSAWFVLSSIGIYPLNPADATYQITSPLFDRIELSLPSPQEDDKARSLFVIDAPGATRQEYMYIDQAILYGHDGSRIRTIFSQGTGTLVIRHDEIMAGGRLYLSMISRKDNPFFDKPRR